METPTEAKLTAIQKLIDWYAESSPIKKVYIWIVVFSAVQLAEVKFFVHEINTRTIAGDHRLDTVVRFYSAKLTDCYEGRISDNEKHTERYSKEIKRGDSIRAENDKIDLEFRKHNIKI